jgi:hypothetical protein
MKKLLFLICIPFIGIAQTDYELAFNSATLDYVEMPNASALIVNSTTFSMTGWVYPLANTTAHSGIMGFRNNIDADFYLLQLQNSNNVEARFRNSSGTSFDVLANNLLDLNQWQHLAFTYDGSNIHLYKNGLLISSTPANGTITQTSESFKIGSLDWNGTGFYMNGSLDEIRLWDAALSQNTISNWMCTEITTSHPNYNNLAGYWRLNEGVGTSTADLSINGNFGALMGAVQWQVTTSCFGSTTPQLTYVPDDNFENYLEANGMGDGIALNDYVFTSAIDTVLVLLISGQSIADFTGIEDFPSLVELMCNNNFLTSLDLSQNTNLEILYCMSNVLVYLDISQNLNLTKLVCWDNLLTSLDVSQNINLEILRCSFNPLANLNLTQNNNLIILRCVDNQLSFLDISQNSKLEDLECWKNQIGILNVSANDSLKNINCFSNQLTILDVSNNINLTYLRCDSNHLSSLDLRNGNNSPMNINTLYNPQLNCINVDDASWSTANWTVANGNIDSQHYFSNDCNATAIEETKVSEKELLKITDVLGRKVLGNSHQPLFYIYNDGSVEKKIIIE